MPRMLNEALVLHELKKEFLDSESRKKCLSALKSVPDVMLFDEPIVRGHWIEEDWVEPDDHGFRCIRYPNAALKCSKCYY